MGRHDAQLLVVGHEGQSLVEAEIVALELIYSLLVHQLSLHMVEVGWVVGQLGHAATRCQIVGRSGLLHIHAVESGHWHHCHRLLAFFLLFGDQSKQVFLASHEIFVSEALTVPSVPRLVEVVHIKLADETRKVVVLEVSRKDLLGELVSLVHNKARPVGVPHYRVTVLRVLQKTHDNVIYPLIFKPFYFNQLANKV